MRIFLSYCFDDHNKWIEELVSPMVSALGFDVVHGRHVAGEVLSEAVNARLRSCAMCLAFATRRDQRRDGTFETHPWVVQEMTSARNWGITTIEVREIGVRIGDGSEASVYLTFDPAARDKLLSELAVRLAELKRKTVRVQLVPQHHEDIFRKHALKGTMSCAYEIESAGRVVGSGKATVRALKMGFFADIEVPNGDFIVKLEVKKSRAGCWMSFGDGLIAIPINLYDA